MNNDTDNIVTAEVLSNGWEAPKVGSIDLLSYGNPRKSAEEFVLLLAGRDHRRALIRWRSDFYRWTGIYWRPVSDDTLTMWLSEFLCPLADNGSRERRR